VDKDENNYIYEKQTSINEINNESIMNKKNNSSKLQTEVNGLNPSESIGKNKETITANNNTSNYPMDTIVDNKNINKDEKEIKKRINIPNTKNIFSENKLQKQEIYPNDNTQSFSVKNSSYNPENENIIK
jgi:hypothetical protein